MRHAIQRTYTQTHTYMQTVILDLFGWDEELNAKLQQLLALIPLLRFLNLGQNLAHPISTPGWTSTKVYHFRILALGSKHPFSFVTVRSFYKLQHAPSVGLEFDPASIPFLNHNFWIFLHFTWKNTFHYFRERTNFKYRQSTDHAAALYIF